MREIESQFNRAEELLSDLETSAQNDLTQQDVSDRTRNLTQEILAKVRMLFDQSMHAFFEKEYLPKLSAPESEKAKVYFLMLSSKSDLKSTLGRGKMKDLETTNPKAFAYLESVQPYYTGY